MSSSKALISIDCIDTAYKNNAILKGVSLSVQVNERWAIIGKNGTGKSTLIKTVASIVEPVSGNVVIEGKDVLGYSARDRARKIAYVPQKPEGIIPYTVYDFIMLGRYSAMSLFAIPSKLDHDIVMEAAKNCDVEHLRNRIMSTLSGGELQRVLLAGAVAQQAPILLLDEPTTYLDPAHEHLFFDALSRVHEHQDLTIMMVTHDINTALSYCTHICGLVDGKVAFSGTSDVFRKKCPLILQNLYGIPFVKYLSVENSRPVFGAWGETECLLAK